MTDLSPFPRAAPRASYGRLHNCKDRLYPGEEAEAEEEEERRAGITEFAFPFFFVSNKYVTLPLTLHAL